MKRIVNTEEELYTAILNREEVFVTGYFLLTKKVKDCLFLMEKYKDKKKSFGFLHNSLELHRTLENYKKCNNIPFVPGDWTDDRLTLTDRATLFLQFLEEEKEK